MKKIVLLLSVVLAFTSCLDSNPVELTATNAITKDIDVTVAQTNGTPKTLNATTTVKLSDVISNVADITDVKINKFTYKFKEFTGNTAGVVQSISLKVNNDVLATGSNIKVSQEADNGTVFQVTDTAKLALLENLLKTSSQANLAITGSVLTDAGSMNFKIEVFVNVTVKLKS